ncbi:Rpn family recombination-promoting nuclease/putative transposase [Aureibacter tunicatorum]|uniref:Transposase/invertase (TIGR01784 family) n=1 Tax=Aureibacter tunicatorum TaxID=866807 RepID=A0AAE3XTA0_9BACT|nr:Rpn family recombination-promoting nuclease/putative transposase [Aureibacter tunicatorum]MDR6241604.1 putative transposase/invertase (TIGR01784 family) [Aureibacter tunicatorum]BDD07172.1 hypothetical protein AUTU_46550 [Aureibacter tunicatorum]
MVEKFINPLTSFGLNKLFGTEENKDLLIDFLNQLLPEKHQVNDLSFYQNENYTRPLEDREAIIDLYCENQGGEKIIVELQFLNQTNFKDRSLYYASFPIKEQAKSSLNWKFDLKGVYTIGIMNFTFDEYKDSPERLLHKIQFRELGSNEVAFDNLTFLYLEIPKFNKQLNELETRFDKWLYLLKNLSQLNERPDELQDRIFQKLFDLAEIEKYNSQSLQDYRASL